MSKVIQGLVQLIIVACLVVGGIIVYENMQKKKPKKEEISQQLGSKATTIKKFLQKFNKPARVEINNQTTRFFEDVEEIKKMKLVLDEQSNFYVTIQFFTDEDDKTAPLVAQFRFIEIKSGNTVKEESINLE